MKVAIISLGVLPFATGGVQVHTYYQVKHMRDLGVEVTVITRRLPPKVETKEIDVEQVGSRIPVAGQIAFVLGAIMRLIRLRPDIVHVHYATYFAAPAYVLNILTGVPYVLTCHGYDVRVWGRNPLWRAIQLHFFRRAAAVTAPSRELSSLIEYYHGLSNDNLSLVPNGIDRSDIGSALEGTHKQPGQKRVVYVANLRPIKDPITAIDAFDQVAAMFNVRLIVIGGGEEYGLVRNRVRELNLQSSVDLVGELPHSETLKVMASCDVLLLTSKEEGGNPLVVMEAMAMGIPPVATRVGGTMDIVESGRNGLLVPPNSPTSVARALSTILGDPALYRELSNAAKETASGYDWKGITMEYLRIYSKAIAKARPEGARTQ